VGQPALAGAPDCAATLGRVEAWACDPPNSVVMMFDRFEPQPPPCGPDGVPVGDAGGFCVEA
jgi:hypothetical protein